MMKIFLLLILAIHTIGSIIFAAYIYIGASFLRRESIIPVVLVPVFGPLAGIVIELLNKLGKHADRPIDLPKLTLGEDIYWKTIKDEEEDENIVPLEEALLINDVQTRREKVLDTLYENPLKYLDVMLVARYNEDIETSHYATTTIAEAQRKYQLQIQKLAVAVEENPNDLALLDEYIVTLEKYVESGLLEDYLLRRQRMIYAKALEKKLSMVGQEKDTLVKYLRNNIELKDYTAAIEVSNILKRKFPEDEQTWIETLRVCVEGHDERKLKETIQEIHTKPIAWTNQGREQVSLWVRA
ncbi:MAG: hypothetical protein FJ010_11515 [Chloroflexi bacterium]|nr:hypothetical protein [Chloroflexota bacterium]